MPLNSGYGAPIDTFNGSHDLVLLGDSLGTLILQGLYVKVTVFLEVGEPLVQLFASSCTTTSTTTCTDAVLGTVTPNIFNRLVTSFGTFPAGQYRVEYLTGACRYFGTPYVLNFDDTFCFRIRHSGGTELKGPGTVDGPFGTQAACELANALAFVEFSHTGGAIGMWLDDYPTIDNSSGNPNPTFQLRLACSDPLTTTTTSTSTTSSTTSTTTAPNSDLCCQFFPDTLNAEMNTDLGDGSTVLNKVVIEGNCAFQGTVTLVDGEVETVATLTIYKGMTNWQYELAPAGGVPCAGFTGESGGGLGPYAIAGCCYA